MLHIQTADLVSQTNFCRGGQAYNQHVIKQYTQTNLVIGVKLCDILTKKTILVSIKQGDI